MSGPRLHVFGAAGAGTTTLGAELANRFACTHLDTDTYYWLPTDPPFTARQRPAARVAALERDLSECRAWVVSGSLMGWGDVFSPRLTHAVYLTLDDAARLQRLRRREHQRFGARIAPGGDMYGVHQAFMRWAAGYAEADLTQRSRRAHTMWLERLPCPVLRLENNADPATLAERVACWLEAHEGRQPPLHRWPGPAMVPLNPPA